MQWFFVALGAPAIWAAVNHIDKYMVSRYSENKKPGSLVIFSSLIAGLAVILIYFFAPLENVSAIQALGGILAGMFIIGGYIPYMYALQEDDVSITAPLWQLIAPLSFFLGAIFLHEYLSPLQMLAGILVVGGAVLLTLNFEKIVWKSRVFWLMVFSSLLIASSIVIYKIVGLESSFWTASFWEYLGAFIFGIILLFFTAYRRDFIVFVREGGRAIFAINVFAEGINVVAGLMSNFASLLAPIALVSVVRGTQPLFIFLYSFLIYKFFPRVEKENFSRKAVLIKLSAILLMIVGSALLFI